MRLLKYKSEEIRMVTPIEFVIEMEEELYDRKHDIREKFDYTKWQRNYFDAKTPEEISTEASQYEKSHPFTGEAVRL